MTLHVEVDAAGDMLKIHDEIDNIERELGEKLRCQATIHMDPVEAENDTVRKLRGKTARLASRVDQRLSIHDFRVVQGETHTNLIFDVVVPYDCPLKDEQVVEQLSQGIESFPGKYYAVIQVDRDLC